LSAKAAPTNAKSIAAVRSICRSREARGDLPADDHAGDRVADELPGHGGGVELRHLRDGRGGGGARHDGDARARGARQRPVARHLGQHDLADAHAEQARQERAARRRRAVGQRVTTRGRRAISPREVGRQRYHEQRVDGAQDLRVADEPAREAERLRQQRGRHRRGGRVQRVVGAKQREDEQEDGRKERRAADAADLAARRDRRRRRQHERVRRTVDNHRCRRPPP